MRRNDLDYARGIAILLILIGHANGMSDLETKLIYSFHVPLFFVISGMLMRYTSVVDKPWKLIWSGWLKRIVIPSVIWETILSVFYFVIKDIPIKQLVVNSVTLNFNLSVLWFIPCLLLAEVVWIIILKMHKSGYPSYINVVIAAVFLVGAMFTPVLFIKRMMVAEVFVIFGFIIEPVVEKLNKKSAVVYATLLTVTAIWLITTILNGRTDLSAGVFGNIVLYYVHSLLGSLMVVIVCKRLSDNLPLLSWIGKNSFGFLVTHVFVRHAIIAVEEMLFSGYWGGWLLAVPMIFIDFIAVWIIVRIVPEVFGQKRAKKGAEKNGK